MPSGTSKEQRVSFPTPAPYRPPSLINLNTPHSIESTLVKVLSQREQFPGYIYAYYSSSYPGMVKIGMTKQERNVSLTGIQRIATRINTQIAGCNRSFTRLYPQPGREATLVQHAFRIEQLIGAELVACRKTLTCKACCHNHREWFETSFKHAVAVIEKYTAYANTKPYVNPGNNIWQISVPHWKTRHDVCEPIASIPTSSMRTEHSTVDGLEDSFHVDEAFSKGSVHTEDFVIRGPDSNNYKCGIDRYATSCQEAHSDDTTIACNMTRPGLRIYRVPAPNAPTEGDIKEEEEKEDSVYTARTAASDTDSDEDNLSFYTQSTMTDNNVNQNNEGSFCTQSTISNNNNNENDDGSVYIQSTMSVDSDSDDYDVTVCSEVSEFEQVTYGNANGPTLYPHLF